MGTNEIVKKLRNKEPITMFDKASKLFHRIQINRKGTFICWQRFVSKDRSHWREWNSYLSIKDVLTIMKQLIDSNTSLTIKTNL